MLDDNNSKLYSSLTVSQVYHVSWCVTHVLTAIFDLVKDAGEGQV